MACSEFALQFRSELLSAVFSIEHSTEQPIQRNVVCRRVRMRDDDVRREFLNVLEGSQIVFVDVDDYVRRKQLAQNIELDILRAADLWDVA